MAKLTWYEYNLRQSVKAIKDECVLHEKCDNCPLVDGKTGACILEGDPCYIDQDKIYPDKEY